MLVISPDQSVARAISDAVSALPNLQLQSEIATIGQMNGKAVQLLSGRDVVVFQADAADPAELDALRRLAAERRGKTHFVALADERMSFAQVRSLTDAGADEVLPLPAQGGDLGAALARLGERSDASAGKGRLFAVIQARGGIGATTLAVNLADQLCPPKTRSAGTSKGVALVDLDLQYGTIGSMLDLPEQDALFQLALDGTMPDAQFLDLAMKTLPSGLSVLPAPSRIGPADSLSAEQVEALLALLRARAEYVVADLPHVMVPWMEPVLRQADTILLVSDTTVPAIRHSRRLIDFLTVDHPDLPVRLVLNHESRPMFRSAALREASRALERPLDVWLPHDGRAARAAVDRGLPLSRVAGRSALTRAIRRLAKSLAAEFPPSSTAHLPS
jgi:pilus assembly protein CpaE